MVAFDQIVTHLKAPKTQRHQPALNATLRHHYKNVCTCAYTYMHICIYTCIIYIDAFCHKLKVLLVFIEKNPPPFLIILKPVSPHLPISSQWASCFECWENTVVILFLFGFILQKGQVTSLASPIALYPSLTQTNNLDSGLV